ncbi:MAG TPA: glycosyltransferase family 4 protein, partial [Vicinamibacterales bacterium]|nr:glycosyltransferase family 4 protein [Vicinamibacterales bacterium]
GETAAARGRWNPRATMTFGARLCAVAAAWPAYERRLRSVLQDVRPDILHTNGLKAHVAGVRAVGSRTAVVWHLHDYLGSRRVTTALLRRHLGGCSAMIANSASVARDAERALGATAPLRVVHNAVDLETFAPAAAVADLDGLSALPPAPAGTIRVGLVATFSKWKGHETFLRALASLSREIPVRGYIIGGPVYDTVGSQYSREELEALARQFGLTVGFTGFIEPAPAFGALDIVVHASTDPEPFGLAIAEAMACGRAVITSAAGGAAELITPDTDAIVHRPGDVEGLCAAIARLAGSPALRSQLGERARASALKRFNRRRLVAEVLDVYERAAAHAALPGRATA